MQAFAYFERQWKAYLEVRGLTDAKGVFWLLFVLTTQFQTTGPAQFPAKYGVAERDAFYNSLAGHGWGGASGHDGRHVALLTGLAVC